MEIGICFQQQSAKNTLALDSWNELGPPLLHYVTYGWLGAVFIQPAKELSGNTLA